jgi:aminoglycoside phosphotransferase (APT) family kinase protein
MTQVHGDLGKKSGLNEYLRGPFERIARLKKEPDLYVTRLGGSHSVYLIKDSRSHKQFILKSFKTPGLSSSIADKRMNKEYGRLKKFESLGIDQSWFKVVKPLGRSDSGQFFVEKYVSGESLGNSIRMAFEKHDHNALYDKLSIFAGYLALLHKKTRRSSHVRMAYLRKELRSHARQSYAAGSMGHSDFGNAMRLIDRACSYSFIRDARRCLVHGDANPSNFILEDGCMHVIDVERSGYRDPVYDLGTMAGELFHYALSYAGNPYRADPFIGHMYWVYSGNFTDQYAKFLSITERNPLYMANSLLRISRNPGLSDAHRKRLAECAMGCLKSLKDFNH